MMDFYDHGDEEVDDTYRRAIRRDEPDSLPESIVICWQIWDTPWPPLPSDPSASL